MIEIPRDLNNTLKWKNFSQRENTPTKKSNHLLVPKKPALDTTFLTQGSDVPLYREDG